MGNWQRETAFDCLVIAIYTWEQRWERHQGSVSFR
jgi:hypothetical protein